MSAKRDAYLRVKMEDDVEPVIFNGAEMVDVQNDSSSPATEDQSQVNNQKRYLAAVVYVQQSGAEGEPDDPGMNTNESAGNLPQVRLPKRNDTSTDMTSHETTRTGEYSYVYRPKRRKITVRNAPQMRIRDAGDYGDYEENGDFVYDYSADYECASDMSDGSYVTDQQRTLVEILNYCQVMYAAIQRLDKKFDVLHRRVTEMNQGRMKPMFFKPRLMAMPYGKTHQMPLNKMKIHKPMEREMRIRVPPPDRGLCSSPLRIRVEKEPLNVSVPSQAVRSLTNPQTMYSCTRGTSPPLPTIQSVQSLQDPAMQGSGTAIGISDFVPGKAIVEQDTRVPKPLGSIDSVRPTSRLYQDGCSSRDRETFVNANITNGTKQQNNFSEHLSSVPSSSATNVNSDYLGDPRRNIKVPAAFLMKAREKNKPKYAARYLVRMLFPRDVLMCSKMEGDQARGIKPLDPNWVTGLREFLCTYFPKFDLNKEGKDWKICTISVNSMIRSLRCEIQRGADITDDNDKALGHEGAQVCVNLDSDGEDEQICSEKLEEPKITSALQQQEWQQQNITAVPKKDRQNAFEPKETLGNPARQVQVPYSAMYVSKQKTRPELAARCLVRHLFPEEVLVRSNVYGNFDRGITPLDRNKIGAIRAGGGSSSSGQSSSCMGGGDFNSPVPGDRTPGRGYQTSCSFWSSRLVSTQDCELRDVKGHVGASSQGIARSDGKSVPGGDLKSVPGKASSSMMLGRRATGDTIRKAITSSQEFLEEVYPVFDLRENGRDWKACVAAINSSIRSIRHDLRKSLPGYYKKQLP